MAHPLKLVSVELCPYVERSRIVLLEKDVAHEVEFIDLGNKPPWFLAVSPMGRVPVLLVDGRPVFESMVINELLEELHPAPTLLPGTPLGRAEARSWIVFANDVAMPASFQTMLALAGDATGDARARPLAALEGALDKLEPQVARGGGPHFAGAPFTLVDCAYAPLLRRLRTIVPWGGPDPARWPAISAWSDAVLARPSVRAAEPSDFAARTRRSFQERAAKLRAG